MYGRGYAMEGDKKAAEFIAYHLKKSGVKFFENSYFQPFNISINTFPSEMKLVINGRVLQAGSEYMIWAGSDGFEGRTGKVFTVKSQTFENTRTNRQFHNLNFCARNYAVVVDTSYKDLKNRRLSQACILLIARNGELSWGITDGQYPPEKGKVKFFVKRSSLPKKVKKVEFDVDAEYKQTYTTRNVIGYIPGKQFPDSFVVFTAHYDHLGMMGNRVLFPGANDNASGTAMLLDLAEHFSKPENQPAYSVAFMFFSAEEVYLLGSEYYTKNPLFPLNKIRFLINLDMVGTGSDGIKVVNGSVFKPEFDTLRAINQRENLLKTVAERGASSNSDHYHFYQNGVPGFFIYTLGKEHKEYHTPGDRAEILPLTRYNELFRLMLLFSGKF